MTRTVSRLFLWAAGWKPEGARPASRRYVLIGAPHTSNWDLAFLLALGRLFDVRIAWMGKHSLFRGPMGWLMRAAGGVPVHRDRRNNLVQQMARVIEQSTEIALTVPAEGTRGYAPHWKSGFYYIAREANVPIVLGYLDYARRRGGFGPEVIPTGDVSQDMDEIRAFYADKQGRYPELAGEVRLKEEM